MSQWGELHCSVKWKWKRDVLGNSLYIIYKCIYLYIKSIHLAVLDLCCGMQTLSCSLWGPWLGIEPKLPALGVWNLSHWTARKVPQGNSLSYLLALLEDHRTHTNWLYLILRGRYDYCTQPGDVTESRVMPGEGGCPAVWIKEGPTLEFFQYKQDLLGGLSWNINQNNVYLFTDTYSVCLSTCSVWRRKIESYLFFFRILFLNGVKMAVCVAATYVLFHRFCQLIFSPSCAFSSTLSNVKRLGSHQGHGYTIKMNADQNHLLLKTFWELLIISLKSEQVELSLKLLDEYAEVVTVS